MVSLSIKGGQDNKAEICLDLKGDCINFTVITESKDQIDFSVEIEEWEQIKDFIDKSINISENINKSLNEALNQI